TDLAIPTFFSFYFYRDHHYLHSFPTRRSSDLYYSVGALEPKFWRTLCDALERPDLVDLQYSEDVATQSAVEEIFMTRTRGEWQRSEEHTSELQSRGHLVCRLLLEKKKRMRCRS